MADAFETTLRPLTDTLMRAVVASGCVNERNLDLACRVMREEFKAFLVGPAYAAERAIVQTGGAHLAMASLATACVARIAAGE